MFWCSYCPRMSPSHDQHGEFSRGFFHRTGNAAGLPLRGKLDRWSACAQVWPCLPCTDLTQVGSCGSEDQLLDLFLLLLRNYTTNSLHNSLSIRFWYIFPTTSSWDGTSHDGSNTSGHPSDNARSRALPCSPLSFLQFCAGTFLRLNNGIPKSPRLHHFAFWEERRWSLSMRIQWGKGKQMSGLLKAYPPTHSHTISIYIHLFPKKSEEFHNWGQLKRFEATLSSTSCGWSRTMLRSTEIYWAPHESTSLSSCKSSPRVFNLCNTAKLNADPSSSKGKIQDISKSTDISDIREVLITPSLPGNSSSTSCNSSAPAYETLIDGTVAGQWRQNTAWIHSLHEWKGEVGITPVAYRCQAYRGLYISILRPHRECRIYSYYYAHHPAFLRDIHINDIITSDICHVLGCVSCPSGGGTWPCSSHHSLSICRIKAFCHSLINWLKIEDWNHWHLMTPLIVRWSLSTGCD